MIKIIFIILIIILLIIGISTIIKIKQSEGKLLKDVKKDLMTRINIITILIVIICIFSIALIIIKAIDKKYNNSDFNIETYKSSIDKDNDGIDDQTDILNNTREYIAKNPQYKSKYYDTGYPNDEYGVCTDVVGFALKDAGYDLQKLINEDIINHKDLYNIEKIDKNIDFRRVRNLKVYFKNNTINLTTDINNIKEWQGGDIIIFKNHIGIVSDKRNKKGITYVIHHYSPLQNEYEEDILEKRNDIIGHYRIS